MGLVYSFDPDKFYLGTPCIHDHYWPGTELSLRRKYVSPRGVSVNHCAACTGPKTYHWLISFIDQQASGVPEGASAGQLCKAGHDWNGYGVTLRNKHRKCIECEKIRQQNRKPNDRTRAMQRASYHRLKRDDEWLAKRRKQIVRNTLRHRALHGRESRSKHGLPHGILEKHGLTNGQGPAFAELLAAGIDPAAAAATVLLRGKLRSAGSAPSVAKLVADEQRRYWSEHPDEFAAYKQYQSLCRYRWRYMTDPEYRLYHRQKSRRRKAQMRNSTADQLTGKQVRQRFAQFNHRCAYCGAAGDLHIEHVHPISKGGAHALSNIVPACQSCNFNKCASEVESWYRAQSFFTEKRWQAICAVTDAGLLPAPRQLSLLLA